MAEKYIQNGGGYGGAIGGRDGNGKVTINGGYIKTTGYSIIGYRWKDVEINGGTIDTGRISCKTEGNIKLLGGNIFVKNNAISTYNGNAIVGYIPTYKNANVYKTQIKIQDIGENKKIESITTSDNIEYGINDMYTLEDGMLYMYLPLGKREITVKVDGKTYKGEVETKEEENVTVLNQI